MGVVLALEVGVALLDATGLDRGDPTAITRRWLAIGDFRERSGLVTGDFFEETAMRLTMPEVGLRIPFRAADFSLLLPLDLRGPSLADTALSEPLLPALAGSLDFTASSASSLLKADASTAAELEELATEEPCRMLDSLEEEKELN